MRPARPAPPPWPVELTDGVVRLRGHGRQDVDAVAEQCRDPETARWTSLPQPYTRAHAREFVAGRPVAWREGREHTFAIEADGVYAGALTVRPRGDGTALVGFALHPAARGRGLVTRAQRLALPWAFETLGVSVLRWRALVGNWPSRRAAWAVGFRHEGTVRGLVSHAGEPVDAWLGSLGRDDPMAPSTPWWDPPVLDGRAAGVGDVVLRTHRGSDVPRIVEGANDPETAWWLTQLPSPYTDRDAVDFLESSREAHATGEGVHWVVADPDTDLLLAQVSVFGLGGSSPAAGEIGYWAHPAARRRGVMTAAARLASRHALLPREDGGLGLRRLLLRASAGNLGSQGVARRAGFTRVGTDRAGHLMRDGTVLDDYRFDLLASELAEPA
jgi:RimJ/RimL family protein N-acetyltransferase